MRHIMFQLIWHPTREESKYRADEPVFILGDAQSVFRTWFELHKVAGWPHVEIFDMAGIKQDPSKGLAGLSGCCA